MSDRMHAGLRWKAITPSDTDLVEPVPASIVCAADGDLVLEGDDGNVETFTAIAGNVMPIQPRRILATGTTATGIVGIYH